VRQRVTAAVGVLALIGLVFAINFYRLPVIALSPGPMEDVLARLKVEGSRVYDSEGKLYLTSVVPPPTSTTRWPVGSWTGRPAPMAAAIGSSTR